MTGIEAMPHDLAAHATSAAMIVYLIEWLKKNAHVTWLTENSATINRLASGLFAAVVALGISASGDAASGWVIRIPAWSILVNGLWEFAQQFIIQQVIYDKVVQPAGATKGMTFSTLTTSIANYGQGAASAQGVSDGK